MKTELPQNTYESEPKITSLSPAIESLFNIGDKESLWPEHVREDKKLEQQVILRKKSIIDLDKIFTQIPQADVRVETTVELNLIDEEVLTNAYKNLTAVLESDPYNARMILYFPFELIPPISFKPKLKELNEVAKKFTDLYMDIWHKLLGVNDVRQNFIEGDVLEPELRTEPLERVTKAAHLIPKLMEKGLISVSEIVDLINDNPGSILQKSVADTLPVLVDMNLLSGDQMNEILRSNGLELQEKKTVDVSLENTTKARAKWLKEKVEPAIVTKHSENQLDMPFSERENILKNDIDILKPITESIESNPELGKFLYPVSILFGSKLKGYGADNADLDVAVFVKPGIPIEEREKLHKLIGQAFSHEKIKGNVVEFWLEEKDGQLDVIDFPDTDKNLLDRASAHVLLEGAWIGNQSAIKELYEKLLPGYLYSKDKTIHGVDARKIWLEEMERDTLQYRLMHKGYARFFSKQGGMNTEHSDQIDGDSMFYDSGYRRLATKLFLSKVFLPQLEK